MHINLELCGVAQQGAAVLKHLASITRSEMTFVFGVHRAENLDDNVTCKDIIS